MAVTLTMSYKVNSQSVANNTSNVTVYVNVKWTGNSYNRTEKSGWCKIDGTTYNFTSSFNYGATSSGTETIFTKTVNVAHNSDGTKTLQCSASYNTGVSSGTIGASFSEALTTIPRKSTLSVGNGTLGTAQTLTVTRKSTSFTHTITAKCGSASTTICTKSTSTSISFTPPLSWASQNTTGTTVSVTYTITTYSGTTNVGSNSYTKTCSIPASVKPSCSLTVTDPTGYADTYGGYLKGLSKFKVVVTATLAQNSPIKSYKTTANGKTYTASSFTTGALSSSGTLTVKTTVTDARSRTGTASKSLTVLDYSDPLITALSVHRCNADGTANDQGEYVNVIFSSSVTALNNKNTATYKLEYKKTSESTYTSVELTAYKNNYAVSNASYIFAADTGSSYNVRVTVTDDFSSGTKTTTASTGFTIMHWLASGLGMAIGKVAELAGVLDIGFKTRFMGGILHPVLEPKTDLNDVRTPNTYVGANVTTYEYANCPLTSGTFTLEVVGMGDSGQVKQRLTYCHKTQARAWERIYYESGWGEWVCVSDFDGQLLWDGASYLAADHTVNLAESISKQKNGIVLVFCRYSNGTAQNYHFSYHFVPKMMVAKHGACGSIFHMGDVEGNYYAAKYIYISDRFMKGNDYNIQGATVGACGITYTNVATVLRYVIGV